MKRDDTDDAGDAVSAPVRPAPVARPSAARAHHLALRGVGLVSLLAFVSLHVQLAGLLGEHGILPLAPRLGRVAFLEAPSLLFLTGPSDASMHALAILGELASLALALGILPGPAALLAWAAHLSFVSVGWPFLPLQWDTLLLESLVLAAATSPWDRFRIEARFLPEPAPIARVALAFLVCRLHFASGLVKLLGGDPHWADLSALDFHFETQPLPGPLSPLAHALPASLHAAMVLATYLLEIVLPLAALARRGRALVAAGFVLLQLSIVATGNFGFFNLLALTLTLALLDDAQLLTFAPALGRWLSVELRAPRTTPRWGSGPRVALVAPLVVLGTLDLYGTLGGRLPEALDPIVLEVHRYHLTSEYGPFAIMTTERREIVLEASRDGLEWEEYDFRWKPDDPREGLPFVPGHMPRMDWMLWFAALDGPDATPWVRALERALLEDRAPVRDLFARVPFDGEAPTYVRAVRWRYRLAPPGAPSTWVRDEREPFGPTMRR